MTARTGAAPLAVWTDFGGVLTPPTAQTLTAFCASTGLEIGPLMQAVWTVTTGYGTDDVMAPLDTPLVTEREWLDQVGTVLRAEHGIELRVPSLADAWFGGRETNHAWVDELRRLRAGGLFVGMLSNMPPAWDAHWRRMVSAEELFDDVVLSFQVGHRKPGREIFDLAARRAGTTPERCVFVDDIERNCAGAVAAGWRAVHFTDTDQAIAALRQILSPDDGPDTEEAQ